MMVSRQGLPAIAGMIALTWIASCAGSPLGDSVQQSLEADPQLEESAPFSSETAQADSAQPTDAEETESTVVPASAPEPGEPDYIGPIQGNSDRPRPATNGTEVESAIASSDLEGLPADLQTYIRDLQALDTLQLTKTATGSDSSESAIESPFGSTITRREYARWLFNTYNTVYADEPGERLRAGSPDDEPAFQDVSPANPDFAAIQGLAEAGIIPSAFTGNSTAVNFRPDAPLVREDLILWKVPLDTRSALPQTTPQAVTESWGFQDTASIDPLALRAIAADFQLGDFSNFRRAFGYTTLFRPEKAVSRAEAAAVLWRFGTQTEGRTAAEAQTTNDDSSN